MGDKAMSWDVFTAALSGAGIAGATVGIILKTVFERAIDTKLKAMEEKTRAAIAEESRRQAAVFDQQFNALGNMLSIAYRLRNDAREVRELSVDSSFETITPIVDQIRKNLGALREILYAERFVVPQRIFYLLHDGMLQASTGLLMQLQAASLSQERDQSSYETLLDGIKTVYEAVDNAYEELVGEIQAHIGVARKDIGTTDK
jgi:phage-related protein